MKKIIYLLLLLITGYQIKAQENKTALLNWLNKNAVDLNSDYLKSLDGKLGDSTVLGLGEASHGTEEFYQEKNKIIKHLVTNKGYSQIGFEVPESAMMKINEYVLSGHGDLKDLLQDFRLYKTKSFFDLFEWIKNHNIMLPCSKIEVFGFDDVNYINPFTRDSLMANNVIERQTKTKTKMIVWAHNLHLIRGTTAGFKALGYFLSKKYQENYFNIVFDTYKGTVNTISSNEDGTNKITSHQLEIPENNLTALFATAKYDSFYAYFRRDNPFSGLKNSITNVWADWRSPFVLPVKLDDDIDAVIFIKNTQASKILNE